MILPFFAIDIFIRIIGIHINYYRPQMIIPNILFTICWISVLTSVILCVPSIVGKFIYWVLFGIFFILFIANGIYYSLTGFFFGFNLLLMADEGAEYVWDAVLGAPPLIYVYTFIIMALAVFAFVHIPKKTTVSIKKLLICCILFIAIRAAAPLLLGSANSSLEWDSWRNPRNVYNDFNDSNKCMKICGIYEYSFRDFYVTFLKSALSSGSGAPDEEEALFLENAYSDDSPADKNDYTGIFSGKNVIFLQLEGMDSWLLNENDTPVLYDMMENSINFTNHYSYYNGGGSTFNSEFAVNTGFITPVSYTKNAYSFHKNAFSYSLANLFKQLNYRTDAFHMNTGEYYQRSLNYTSWGYDNYFSLMDLGDYDDLSYELDRELILNETFNNEMFNGSEPFLYTIISFTPHTPFTTDKGVGRLLAEYKYGSENIPDLSEEECARLMVSETDYMVELLLDALEANGLLDNTVIVVYADHYLYTLNDKNVLVQYKNTENNLINNTPFFIWSSDIESETITKVNSQLDILPTVLNMFGIDYSPSYYIGRDIFDPDYSGYVFFDDYSWYDGNAYVENGIITNGASMSNNALQDMNDLINSLIRKNDLTLKYNYFKD